MGLSRRGSAYILHCENILIHYGCPIWKRGLAAAHGPEPVTSRPEVRAQRNRAAGELHRIFNARGLIH